MLNTALESQYRAGLEMLRQAIDATPDSLWSDSRHRNPTWRVAYHAIFYTHLYLSPSEEEFVPWEHGSPGLHFFEEPTERAPIDRERMMEYLAIVDAWTPSAIAAVPMESPSGFDWISFNRMQLHIYNIRHLQHHAGQLIERLRNDGLEGTSWVGRR